MSSVPVIPFTDISLWFLLPVIAVLYGVYAVLAAPAGRPGELDKIREDCRRKYVRLRGAALAAEGLLLAVSLYVNRYCGGMFFGARAWPAFAALLLIPPAWLYVTYRRYRK